MLEEEQNFTKLGKYWQRDGGVHSTLWKYSTLRRNSVCIFSMSSERIEKILRNLGALIQVSLDHFETPILEIWNICACVNCSYSLLHIFYKFLDIVWIWTYIGENFLMKEGWSTMIFSTWSRDLFVKMFSGL